MVALPLAALRKKPMEYRVLGIIDMQTLFAPAMRPSSTLFNRHHPPQ